MTGVNFDKNKNAFRNINFQKHFCVCRSLMAKLGEPAGNVLEHTLARISKNEQPVGRTRYRYLKF